jgi:vancomycin resistance protein YoaR
MSESEREAADKAPPESRRRRRDDGEERTKRPTPAQRSGAREREASTIPDRTDTVREPSTERAAPPRRRRLRWLALVPLLALLVGFAVDRARHTDRPWRGVEVAGQDVSGLDREATAAAIARLESELSARTLRVELRGRSFEIEPTAIGFRLDRAALLAAALATGRGSLGEEARAWLAGLAGANREVAAAGAIDVAALEPLLAAWEAEAVDDPPFEGAVTVVEGRATADPPRRGHRIDRDRAATILLEALLAPAAAAVPLPLVEVAPTRKAAAIEAAVGVAEQLLADAVILRAAPPADGEDPKRRDEEHPPLEFRFERTALAAALRSRLVDPDGVEVYFDPEALEEALKPAREALERPPVDAQFEVGKRDAVSIISGRPGRVIDAEKVAKAIFAAAQTGQREGVLPVDQGAAPAFSTEDAQALHVDGLVSAFTTTFGCCRPRVKNIHRIAELVDGVLVKPGETFSLNERVGERTVARGFVPAPTIVHGKMKDTIGGGISQFATTFFNAALQGGYEIVERQPHSFYFKRYPMGHEATLSFPKPDVIIKNDTDAGLFIKTEVGPTYVRVKLFGNNGARKVEKKVSKIFDVIEPPIEYIADDSLDPDEKKIKERGQKGWTVNVSRTIAFADGREKTESRKVVYNPRVRKLRVHSCRIPKGEDGYTGQKCPEKEQGDEAVALADVPPEAAGSGSDAED